MKSKMLFLTLVILVLAFGCSKSETIDDEQDKKNNSGLTLVNQLSLRSSDDEFGIDIVATDFGYIVCGITVDERPYLIAINDIREVLWEKTLGTEGVGGFEKIIKTRDGNYVAAGFADVTSKDLDLDLYAVKINATGQVIWEKNYGFSYINDTTVDLIETSNGDLLIAATKIVEPLSSSIEDYNSDVLVIKVDADGNLIWDKTYGGQNNETLSSVIEEDNGNYLIGCSLSFPDSESSGNITLSTSDVLIIRTDSKGNVIEEKTFGSSESDGPAYLHKISNGQIVVVSSSRGSDQDVSGTNQGESDAWLFTLNHALNITNQVSIGGAGRDSAVKLIENDKSEFYLVGDTNSNNTGSDLIYGSSDVWILKLSSSFNVIKEVIIGGSGSDSASSVVKKGDEIVVVGSTDSNDGDVNENHGSWDIWLTFFND